MFSQILFKWITLLVPVPLMIKISETLSTIMITTVNYNLKLYQYTGTLFTRCYNTLLKNYELIKIITNSPENIIQDITNLRNIFGVPNALMFVPVL